MGELKKYDWLIILYILANMFRMFGVVMVIPSFVAIYYKEYEFAWLFFALGLIFVASFSVVRKVLKVEECDLKHAVSSLVIAWLMISIVSAIPFMYYGMGFIDSLFESFSGWSSTGLSMIPKPESIPFSLNFWRAFIEWVGGFGIIVLVLLVYEKPKTAQTLFLAEGRTEDFFVNFLSIARVIVLIYAIYTLIGTVSMWLSGMTFFDSIFHSMTSIATGGFSSNSIGVGVYGLTPMIITIFLMTAGSISFVSHHHLLNGRLKEFWKNPEVRLLFFLIIFCAILVALEIFVIKGTAYFDSLLYTVSSITGTGAVTTVSVDSFPDVAIMIFIFLMICGGTYGSTAGAIKLWRFVVILKIIRRQVLKIFLPEHVVMPIKVGNTHINEEEALKIISYIFLYLAVLFIGVLIFMFFGYSTTESIFTVASAQGNVGLNIIPADAYYLMNPFLKLLLILHMLLGRIEIIPFLVLVRSFRFIKRT